MVTDHLGNKFETQKEMCEYWGINKNTFNYRLQHNWSLKECLTGRPSIGQKGKIKDHLGNEFNSATEMFRHYNVKPNTGLMRLKKGWSIEEAILGTKEITHKNKPITDHLGNKFKAINEMCEYWKIKRDTFEYRRRHNWSLKECLTGRSPMSQNGKIKDHLGNEFNSATEMFKHYNIKPDIGLQRLNRGWSIKEAILGAKEGTIPKNKIIKDHKNNVFTTQKEMCDYYNINVGTFQTRIKNGWSLEEALTKTTTYEDHKGNTFKSQSDMCNYYNIKFITFHNRIKKGWSLEKALTSPAPSFECKDHLGNKYPSISKMCDFYNISHATYLDRIEKGYTLEEALGIIPTISCNTFETTLTKKLYILRPIPDELNGNAFYFKCIFNNKETIMTRNEIVTYLLSELKKEEQDATTNHKENQDHASCRPRKKPVQFHAGNV